MSQVTSENPDSSKDDSTEDKKDIAIYQLQKNQLDQKKQIQLCFNLNLQSNSGMLLLKNKELAQSGEITIEDIPEGPEKECFETDVGEWTISDLHRAAGIGDIERVKFLTKYGSNINAMNARKWTPLHYASFDGSMDVVEHLAAKGANLDAKTIIGATPLFFAAS